MKWYKAWRLRVLRKKIAMMQVGIDETEIMVARVTGADGYLLHLTQHVLKLRIAIGHLRLKEKELSK